MAAWSLDRVPDLLSEQSGVISRAQILAAGGTDAAVRRLVRRRELSRLHPGVYLTHTGRPTRRQREWAAVLALWPAALAGPSALPGAEGDVVHVAVDSERSPARLPGVVVSRTVRFRSVADPSLHPPRVRLEHALIDVVSAALRRGHVAAAFSELCRVCGTRRTTPDRVLAAIGTRERVPHRRTLEALLTDLRDGVCSVLERGYVHLVERPHGLPTGGRQVRSEATGRVSYQDVRYDPYALLVELDGRHSHDSAVARDRDALRDLAERAIGGHTTVRLTYGLVFRTPCRTAALIAQLLRERGWSGELRRCCRCPPEGACRLTQTA